MATGTTQQNVGNQQKASSQQDNMKDKTTNTLNGSPSLFSQESVQELSESVTKMTDKVREATESAVSQSIDFAKKYPVHTVLGAVAVGFVAGLLMRASASGKAVEK